MVSKKKIATNNKWDKENYDKIMLAAPKGTKQELDDLKKQGKIKSYNDFFKKLTLAELDRLEQLDK